MLKKTTFKNWNTIDPALLAKNDQKEITNLYKLTKPFFLKTYEKNEELFHDFILKVLKYIPTYNPNFCFSTWLYKVGMDFLCDHIRRIKVEKKRQHLIEDAYLWCIQDSFTQENKEQLERFIGELRPKQQLFLDKYLDNKAHFTLERHKYSYILGLIKQKKTEFDRLER